MRSRRPARPRTRGSSGRSRRGTQQNRDRPGCPGEPEVSGRLDPWSSLAPIRATTPYLYQAACVLAGLGLVASAATVPDAVPPPFLLAGAFALLYVAVAWWTRGRADPATVWRDPRLGRVAGWMLAGIAIQVVPCILTQPRLVIQGADWSGALLAQSAASWALTAATVLWEELWFRGPVLNLVEAGRRQVAFAVANGALFAGLHLLNPQFHVLRDGPEVFAAGAVLTVLYFASGSFLAPYALHLGNNVAGGLLVRAVGEADATALDTPSVSALRGAMLLGLGALLAGRLLRSGRASGAFAVSPEPPRSPGETR